VRVGRKPWRARAAAAADSPLTPALAFFSWSVCYAADFWLASPTLDPACYATAAVWLLSLKRGLNKWK
jgi:hypothetical protein